MVVGRFQVMSILQAARAKALGLSMDSALSWGLNRAIFIAAAKRGFKGGTGGTGRGAEAGERKETSNIFKLGDDFAFKAEKEGKLYFQIGGEVQTPELFARQVKARFTEKSYREAWQEAQDIIGKYDRSVLESGRLFYEEVYKPRRDELAKKWTELTEAAPRGKGPRRK